MFDTYSQIFDRRADAYHAAMRAHPLARHHEFEAVLQRLAPVGGERVLDAPAGGGYLKAWLPARVTWIAVEPAAGFSGHLGGANRGDRLLNCALEAMVLPASSVDACVSLAGVHHLPDRSLFYREVARVLRPGGRFVLADVATDSPVAQFLNGYCNEANSMGHDGCFLGEETPADLDACGFDVVADEQVPCPWSFTNRAELGYFCRLLFGLDRAGSAEAVCAAAERTVGLDFEPGRSVRMAWSLRMLTCTVR